MAECTVRGVRFHVQRLGGGEATVVLLHGLIMDNLSSWYFTLANPLARRATVLLYDLRGHGKSERTPSGYRLDEMVDDLAGILEAMRLADRRIVLVGHSFGGVLASAFALRFPRQIDRLAFIDGQLSDPEWIVQMQQTLRLQGERRDRLILKRFRHWLGRHSERKRNRLAQQAYELVHNTSLVDDLAAFPCCTDQQLASLRSPALAIYGANSDVLRHGERLARTLRRCELHVLPGCTHSVFWEATEKVKSLLLPWMLQDDPVSV